MFTDVPLHPSQYKEDFERNIRKEWKATDFLTGNVLLKAGQ
jgi:hypothetical protein